jgi:TctA family transporter
MPWYLLALKFLPTIMAAIKAAVDAMPTGSGKDRLEGAIAFVMAAEGIETADQPNVQKAINGVYAMLKKNGQVAAPAAAAAS